MLRVKAENLEVLVSSGGGGYDAYKRDPEHALAGGSSMWELQALCVPPPLRLVQDLWQLRQAGVRLGGHGMRPHRHHRHSQHHRTFPFCFYAGEEGLNPKS